MCEINQIASKGVTGLIDNLILQSILKLIEEAKLKDEDMLLIQLDKCPFCTKQHILVKSEEIEIAGKDNEDVGVCVICSKPVDAKVLVYQFKLNDTETQIICLESEAEEMLKEHNQ